MHHQRGAESAELPTNCTNQPPTPCEAFCVHWREEAPLVKCQGAEVKGAEFRKYNAQCAALTYFPANPNNRDIPSKHFLYLSMVLGIQIPAGRYEKK